MTPKEAAEALDKSQYMQEVSGELFKTMKDSGLVAVFGASDDLMEFRGVVNDEVGAYDGGEAFFTKEGILTNVCPEERCPHFERMKTKAAKIEALWCEEDGYSWTYRTSIPHETFEVFEDEEKYCRGIVFALSDVP